MRATKFIRKGNVIRELKPETSDKLEFYGSNNIAKKISRKLQMKKDGALGRGSVRIIK